MSNPSEPRDRAAVIDDAVGGMQRWGLRIIVIALAAVIVGKAIGTIWVAVYPVAMALIVTTVLGPPVNWLRAKGWPSSLAAASVMLTFLGSIAALIAILTPQVAGSFSDIADGAVAGLQEVRNWLINGPLGLSEGQVTKAIDAVQGKIQESAAAISAGIFSTLGAATNVIINMVLILMLTFFFMKDGHKFIPWARGVGGNRAGHHTTEVLSRAWATLGGFIRTQTLVALIDAVIIGVGLAILGVDLAIPLAVITFFAAYIPIIGAFVSGALAVLVTLVTNSPRDALIALIIVVAVQQLEGNVLSPMLQGKNLNLHPALVLLGVTAGGTLFGITGAFLAVPAIATSAEVLRYINERIGEATDPLPEAEAAPEESDV